MVGWSVGRRGVGRRKASKIKDGSKNLSAKFYSKFDSHLQKCMEILQLFKLVYYIYLVLYLDQRIEHAVCWLKTFVFALNKFFCIFPSLTEKSKKKERKAAQKHAIKGGSTSI